MSHSKDVKNPKPMTDLMGLTQEAGPMTLLIPRHSVLQLERTCPLPQSPTSTCETSSEYIMASRPESRPVIALTDWLILDIFIAPCLGIMALYNNSRKKKLQPSRHVTTSTRQWHKKPAHVCALPLVQGAMQWQKRRKVTGYQTCHYRHNTTAGPSK